MAKHFEKEHKHVLRDIRIILEADEDGFSESNFGLSSYLTEQNKEMPMYVMSKDGFVLLVMGYTGPEAMRMKKAYIARFNEMEEQLRAASPLLPNFRDPIAAAEAWIVAERARLAEQARADYYQRTKAEIGSRREATARGESSRNSHVGLDMKSVKSRTRATVSSRRTTRMSLRPSVWRFAMT